MIAAAAVPAEASLVNVYDYPVLSEEDERVWNDLFDEVVDGRS